MASGGCVISRSSPSTRKRIAVVIFVGLEVQVGGAQVDRVDQHLLQEAHDRRVLDFARGLRLVRAGVVTSSVTSNSKSPEASASIVSFVLAPVPSSALASLSCSTITHSGESCVANLIRSAASWSVGSAPPMKMRLPRLPRTTIWYCAASLASMMFFGSFLRVDRRQVEQRQGQRRRQGVREVRGRDRTGGDDRGDEAGPLVARAAHQLFGGLGVELARVDQHSRDAGEG